MKNLTSRLLVATLVVSSLAGVAGASAPASAAPASAAPLTNLAHLDFLLDTATPPPTAGHTTYQLASSPALTVPWTYADARDGGTFARVGGGPLDPATGHYGQGAYNADDITRAAVVYLRHWTQTGSKTSRSRAYELLRSVAYLQTSSGPNAGNVVLWMQSDGTLNPSPTPVEQPSPSDSGASYWLARSLWAFGEGYAAFKAVDPAFAAFLKNRLALGVAALDREVLNKYGTYAIADGVRVPAWLIVDGADASAEAVLGLAAYSGAQPADVPARTALAELAEGIAKMGSGTTRTWPYGAILPWAQSQSMWHSWSSQMPAALARASVVLEDQTLLAPAVRDSVGFTTTLLTGGGPDNGWYPTPVDRTQIAYGADSRLQSLLAVADAGDLPGLRELAGMMGSWFFGMNAAKSPVYSPATGVTYDGVQADGTINRNSGAESTIHGLLSMLALDAHPDVAARAQHVATVTARDGLTVVEAETAVRTSGTVVTPASAWTGESQFSGGRYLQLAAGESATIAVAGSAATRHIEPVVFDQPGGSAFSVWRAGFLPLGVLRHSVGAQGITGAPGQLRPQPLLLPLLTGRKSVTVTAVGQAVSLDALIVRPLLSRLSLAGTGGSTQLVHSTSVLPLPTTLGSAGSVAVVRVYDGRGILVSQRAIAGVGTILLPAGGFAVLTR